MRIFEGRQATINKVSINGNDRLYENVVRRELRTRPGQLFSREDLMRSMREIQQMGHFDPEQIQPDIQPKPEDGTAVSYTHLWKKPREWFAERLFPYDPLPLPVTDCCCQNWWSRYVM